MFRLTLLLFFICATGCADHDLNGSLNGNYTGTFYRVRDNVKGETANVTLTFSNHEYTGTSSIVKYPALCRGTFAERSGLVNFTNSCMWTAEFDWTLILNGEFKVVYKVDEVVLSKEYNNGNGDFYVLKKQ
jgi:hypothetical protein